MTVARLDAASQVPLNETISRLILPISVAAISLSALLLFLVQPMFAKMVLPALGGSPAVWSVAMVFFQTVMLLGYLYAQGVARLASTRAATLAHLAVLGLAFLSLPVALRAGEVNQDNPALWLIGVFAVSVGLPFFALSAQGPLLQAWFARSAHPRARDPYFLYAASNAGSFAALLAYPFLIEPLFGLSTQSVLWTAGFAIMAGLVAATGFSAWAAPASVAHRMATPLEVVEAPPIAPATFLKWVGLSFVPSGLLVSVTAHVSTDIGATPLLWVIPLGLYLLTFVLAFQARPLIGDRVLAFLLPIGATLVLASMMLNLDSFVIAIFVHLAAFFVGAFACQRALYQSRPDPSRLTAFYTAISLGGALGGLFAGLLAPSLFSSILEYPLLIVALLLCRPGLAALTRATPVRDYMPVLVVATAGVLAEVFINLIFGEPAVGRYTAATVFAVMMLLEWRRPQLCALIGFIMLAHLAISQKFFATSESLRSFFGVSVVDTRMNGQFRILRHGTTIHGAERIRNPDGSLFTGRPLPTSYYHPLGPIAEAINAARATDGSLTLSVVGLGAGEMACLSRPGDNLAFYEIDPVVIRIARDPSRFRFLTECAPQASIVLGDGRLTLRSQSNHSDAIVVDAFSSDAIPVHLLTREAIALYLTKLTERGIVVLHISNNFVDLRVAVARSAADLGLATYVRQDFPSPDPTDMRMASVVAVLTRDPAHLGPLLQVEGRWKRFEPNMASRPWTDDYSTILPAIRRR